MEPNNLSSSSDDSDEDEETGAVNNLLDIKGRPDWNATEALMAAQTSVDEDDDGDGSKSTPTSKIYEPKFIQVFSSYIEGRQVDLNAPLMSLCLDHLITFCIWARESSARNTWIRSVLDDNPDLRPEVRNGLAMVFIYSLSAAKAAFNHSDMFYALREPDTGLGIVNKTSLKIYNDPFNYFNFLKSCMSGLIDAGVIPENERQNQVSILRSKCIRFT